MSVARIKLVGVRLTAGEFVRIAAAAEGAGLPLVSWIRNQALRAVDLQTSPPAPFEPPLRSKPADLLTHTASTRFTEGQFLALDEHARACGLTVASYIRQVVLGFTPAARRPLERSAIVAVNRVGNNLNQLVHLANSGILLPPDLLRAVAAVRAEIHALQDAFFRADQDDASELGR
jgi:Mobilization protein NikA